MRYVTWIKRTGRQCGKKRKCASYRHPKKLPPLVQKSNPYTKIENCLLPCGTAVPSFCHSAGRRRRASLAPPKIFVIFFHILNARTSINSSFVQAL